MEHKVLVADALKTLAKNPQAFKDWDEEVLTKLTKNPVKAMELLKDVLETREF